MELATIQSPEEQRVVNFMLQTDDQEWIKTFHCICLLQTEASKKQINLQYSTSENRSFLSVTVLRWNEALENV